MRAELITNLAALEPIEDRWRELAELRGNAFISPEWFRAWWAQRPESVEPLVVAVRRDGGEVAGVMPLVLDRQRRPAAIRFAGASWGDRFGIAAAGQDEVEVATEAVAALGAADPGLDRRLLALDHVEVDAAWWRELRRSSGKRYARFAQQCFEVSYIDLDGLDWDSYLASRSRNFRQQLRKRDRILREEHGVEIRAASAETLEVDLAHLFSLHERRWEGRGQSSLATPGVIGFLNEFAAAAQRRGWLRLRLLEADGEPVAAFMGWRLGDVYAFYQSGFDPAWADRSVGTVMMGDTVRSAIEEGAAEFDMLLGNEPYKARFANASRDLQTVVLTPPASPTRVLAAGEARARRIAERLREQPGLAKLGGALRRALPSSSRF
jgi:CelD/BcsL family acetyltransferase involved in cellulose biosynthesis